MESLQWGVSRLIREQKALFLIGEAKNQELKNVGIQTDEKKKHR